MPDEKETLEDKFAMAIVTGLMSDPSWRERPWDEIMEQVYEGAAAAMRVREGRAFKNQADGI